MKNIFLGFLFVMLDFNLNIGASTIGLIPDFIGFWFFIKGMEELTEESNTLAKNIGLSMVLMVCSGVIYLIELLGIQLGLLGIIIGLAMTIAQLYLEYQVITGMFELEAYNNHYFGADDCKTKWIFAMAMILLNYVFMWFPIINIVGILVAFAMCIVFLVSVNAFKNNYYE